MTLHPLLYDHINRKNTNSAYGKKKLIIFGAGASFGSEKNMPPLGKDLFHDLQKAGPNSWGAFDRSLSDRFEDDFESALDYVKEKNTVSLIGIQKSLAGYFAKFRPTSNSLYVKLLRMIKETKTNISVATLNYDRLLQISMGVLGLTAKFDSAVLPNVEVCYPHGCCNFFCEGVRASNGVTVRDRSIILGKDASMKLNRGGRVTFAPEGVTTDGASMLVVNDPKIYVEKISEDLPPVMSYFIPSKFTTSCHNFLMRERKRLEELIMNAEVIAIIGVAVREHDKHIWDPLASTRAKIVYCSGSGDKKYSEWARHSRASSAVVLPGHWDENFDEICSRLGF